jgi:peptidoglycan-N-acetylglucosamine deacetylase
LKKANCTIQVDLDGEQILLENRNYQYSAREDPIFNKETVFRFLVLFDTYNIKATFFVVGRDLLDNAKKKIIKEIVERGHEIANHSMNHIVNFRGLNRKEKEREIKDAEEIIGDIVGVRPIGFRAPNFDIDETTLEILEARGYIYDSSILPAYLFSNKNIHGFSPLSPYYPSQENIWRKGQRGIIEIPVSTVPIIRVPYHSSFVIAAHNFNMGHSVFNTGFFLTKLMRLPLNYVFHVAELADSSGDLRLSYFQGLRMPLKKRYAMINSILKKIAENRTVFSTNKFIKFCGNNSERL